MSFSGNVAASPFGQGVFGADVPFGSVTSLSINLGSNVTLAMTPTANTFSAASSHVVTITSTDVVGYQLYAHTLGTSNMVNGSAIIPTSANSSAGPLAVNSWGYNTAGSTTNYVGLPTTSTLLRTRTGPYKAGDATTVNYGAYADITKDAGNYTVSVIYTAVAANP